MDFERDQHNVLCISPRKYVERMMESYKQMFGSEPPKNVSSALEPNDHPELDDSELFTAEDIQKYQSLIGTLQWPISIGRMDIATAVMTMSSFRASPRKGHMDRAK